MKTKDSAIKHIDVNHRKSVLPMTHSDFIGKHCDLRMTIRGDFVGKNMGRSGNVVVNSGPPNFIMRKSKASPSKETLRFYPLVNCPITMENHHF